MICLLCYYVKRLRQPPEIIYLFVRKARFANLGAIAETTRYLRVQNRAIFFTCQNYKLFSYSIQFISKNVVYLGRYEKIFHE